MRRDNVFLVREEDFVRVGEDDQALFLVALSAFSIFSLREGWVR